MAIHFLPFPGVQEFNDEQRAWNMSPTLIDGKYVPTFWVGPEHRHWLGHEWLTEESPFYEMTRERLWKELHEWRGGLHRIFRNQRRIEKYGEPSIWKVNYFTGLLVWAAQTLHKHGEIALMYEDNLEQAQMIARCIQWVYHIVYEVGDYRKHERNM